MSVKQLSHRCTFFPGSIPHRVTTAFATLFFKDEVGSRGAVTRHVRRKRPLGVAASVLLPRGGREGCREGNRYCEVEGNVGVRWGNSWREVERVVVMRWRGLWA